MRSRSSSRLLVIDEQNRVLLFKFVFKEGALAGKNFWATPGGTVDAGETFEEAAMRELHEETGIRVHAIGDHITERQFVLPLPNGEDVMAHEKFYLVRTSNPKLTKENQTDEESNVMADYRWWHVHELRTTAEEVFPENLADLLSKANVG